MIVTTDLSRHYTMGDTQIFALDRLSLTIPEGQAIAVVGTSGSGKSTLMHLIGALDTPTSGSLRIGDVELTTLDDDARARYRNETVGFVFQSFYLQHHLSALENVELPLKIRGLARRERRKQAIAQLEAVGLGDRVRHRPAELSGGQRQRVCVARALAGNPKVLLADEPTGNLDTATSTAMIDLFTRLNRERNLTLVVVTHDMAVAERMQRQVHLSDGHMVRDILAGAPCG